MSVTLPVRKVNPVYQYLRSQVFATYEELKQEYESEGELKEQLKNRNRGVRCFMNNKSIFDEDKKEVEAAIAEFSRPESKIVLHFSVDSGLETALCDEHSENLLLALYVPNSAPCDTIFGGIPCELTEAGIRSTLTWQLKAPAMHLSESPKLCELFVKTSFFVPNVEFRKSAHFNNFQHLPENERQSLNLVMMSDMESVISYLEQQGKADIKLSNLIYTKLFIPFAVALRQNQNRKKLGLPPIRNLVIGDMALRSGEKGVNALTAQRLESIVKMFDGCFDDVYICGPTSLLMHLSVHFGLEE